MGPQSPTLLQPRWPPADDRDMLMVLGLLARLTAAGWVELDLQLSEGGSCRRYRWGEGRGVGHELALRDGGSVSATLRLGCEQPPPDAVAPVATYLVRKVLTTRWLAHQAALLRGALDATSSAVLLFDSGGDIVYANPPADSLLSRQTEKGLDVRRPGAQPTPLITVLCSLVEGTAGEPSQHSQWNGTLSLDDGTSLACEVMRVSASNDGARCGTLAVLQPVAPTSRPPLHDFAATHHLSPREGDVLCLLREGLSTQAIADRLGITAHTVRDHLKHLYRKTDTGSRGELLGLLSSPPDRPR